MHALAHFEVFQYRHWPTVNFFNAGIVPLWSLSMQALAHCELFQCRHWHTRSQPMQALAHCEVNKCRHWLFMKSSNVCIGRLWCHPMQALRSTVEIEFSKLLFLFIWCTYKVWIPMFGHWFYLFHQPPSPIKLDHNVWHNSKADLENIFIHELSMLIILLLAAI